MNLEEFGKKRVMHIDTSGKLHQRMDTAIAYRILSNDSHKGTGLKLRMKKELENNNELNVKHDYARIYAICIYFLIKDVLDEFDALVICNDENFVYVKGYLDLLFIDDKKFKFREVMSISDLRDITGIPNLKSQADSIVSSYRKRIFKSEWRQQIGRKLNPVEISFSMIYDKWKEIEDKMKNSVSGE